MAVFLTILSVSALCALLGWLFYLDNKKKEQTEKNAEAEKQYQTDLKKAPLEFNKKNSEITIFQPQCAAIVQADARKPGGAFFEGSDSLRARDKTLHIIEEAKVPINMLHKHEILEDRYRAYEGVCALEDACVRCYACNVTKQNPVCLAMQATTSVHAELEFQSS